MEIAHDDFHIKYEAETGTIVCSGSLELRGKEDYADLIELLKNVVAMKPPVIVLDIQNLEFLNTTGITTLGGFIIGIRKMEASRLKVLGTKAHPWQIRAFKGLGKLLPEMETLFV